MIVTLGLVLTYCYEAVLDGLVIAILWLLNLVEIDSFQKFCQIIESASVSLTPTKDNDLPKMKHGFGNTGRYMLKCMNLRKDAKRHFGMDSDHQRL